MRVKPRRSFSQSHTFLAYRLQKVSEAMRDSADAVAGEPFLRQQERQLQVQPLLHLDVPSFTPDQVIR